MQSESFSGLNIAIIMDGNGRWATQRGLSRLSGHRAGAATVERVVQRASDLGIASLTLYAFSSDNWSRPMPEVQGIFWLLRAYLRMQSESLRRRGVRLCVIGRRDRLPAPVLREIELAEERTAEGRGMCLRVAVDYSSRYAIAQYLGEISSVSNRLIEERMHAVSLQAGEIDLLIRTGGEKRLSDFLLWEAAYAELIFTDTMWPDFDAQALDEALHEFSMRERRFGAIPAGELAVAGAAR
jgi:undecaprenyl diphosphate synthase